MMISNMYESFVTKKPCITYVIKWELNATIKMTVYDQNFNDYINFRFHFTFADTPDLFPW